MKIAGGRDIRGKLVTCAVAGMACFALLVVATLSSLQNHGEAVAETAETTSLRFTPENGKKQPLEPGRKLLTEAEIDAMVEEEVATAEEMDANATENEEYSGLFSSIDELSEMIEAATSECVESGTDDDPAAAEGDVDYNASEVVLPCGDEDEMDGLELQLSEVNMELANLLDDGTDGLDGDSGGLDFDGLFEGYKKIHKGNADDDIPSGHPASSKGARKAALKKNIAKMKKHNTAAKSQGNAKGRGTAAVDTSKAVLNKFSDWDDSTFDEIMFAGNEDFFAEGAANLEGSADAPGRRNLQAFTSQTSFSWVGSGRLGKVVNQGPCGSCYLNAVVTEVESALAIENGETPLELSREQIKNCQKENYLYESSSPRGCNGGWMQYSYEYIRRNWIAGCKQSESDATGCDVSAASHKGGITLAEHYPYVARNLKCGYDEATMPKRAIVGNYIRMSGHTYISPSEANFKKALEKGPVVVALTASGWGSYGGGIMTCSSTRINHAVLLVGWGEENGKKYWLIQNSWGTNWGEGGFIRIHRGLNADGTESMGQGKRGDKGCSMTVYGGFQSNFVKKVDPSVQDCQGTFDNWSECSNPCGDGQQTRRYSITTPAANGGLKCPYKAGYEQSRKCKHSTEIVEDWSTCSAACNGGDQIKQTRIKTSNPEVTCPTEEEKRACNTHLCPNACLIVKDAAYSFLNGNYRPSEGPNPHDRCSGDVPIFTNDKAHRGTHHKLFWYKRRCSSDPDGYWVFGRNVGNGGYMWSRRSIEGTSPLSVKSWWNNRHRIKIEAVDCSLLPMDCDYKWDDDWSTCSADCDGGVQYLNYTVLTPAANGGRACPEVKSRPCNVHSCGAKCMKVDKARYRFLNGVYQQAEEGGWTPTFCGGEEMLPRYSKTVVRKYWWRTYTYKYDLVYKNNRCRRRNGAYEALGGQWALGKVYEWTRRGKVYVYAGSYDRSPYRWWNYIRKGASNHPHVAGWEESAEMSNDWYRKGVTTVTEVACGS